VSTFKFRTLRDSARIEAILTYPVFDWYRVPGRFFSMMHEALAGKIVTNPSDFSMNLSSNLSEMEAKYRLFGGAASVTLRSDKLVLDFPNLVKSDYPIITDVAFSLHDALPKAFPELNYSRIDAQSAEHLEILENDGVNRLLERYRVPGLERSFNSPVVAEPGIKFGVTAQDQRWQCSFIAERSVLSAAAVFVLVNVSLRDASAATPFLKFEAVSELVRSCRSALGLEDTDASVS
jgi:hypothetical protein